MAIKDILDATSNAISNCEVAAFGDTDTRLMLRACHQNHIRREHLDALCDQAAHCFNFIDTALSLQSEAIENDADFNEATCVSADKTTIFVRTDFTSPDFLCLVCTNPQEPDALLKTAHDALQKINAVQ